MSPPTAAFCAVCGHAFASATKSTPHPEDRAGVLDGEIGASIYLGDARDRRLVEAAVVDLLDAFGFEVIP